MTTTTTTTIVIITMMLELSVPHVSYVFGTNTKMPTSELLSKLDWC